jgi:pyruvate,water dikinase
MQSWIKSLTLEPDFVHAVDDALQTIGPGPYAVRSSMVGEDSANFSFAGQLETFLYQRSLDDVVTALCACWASCLSARVTAYRQRVGPGDALPRMGVVIQRMIGGQVSGVAFSSHPVTGVRDHVLITGAWGLGEGVVSGLCNADDYTCSHSGEEIDVTLADKDRALVESGDGSTGTVEVRVSEDRRKVRCLSQDQVLELTTEVCRLATTMERPQDIEWTIDNETLYLLQARPITNLVAPPNTDGPRQVFDNSNIQESYCGVTTPLTFSFAARAYHSVYNQTMRTLGMSDAMVQLHDERHRHMLGLIRGRIYYNINNWYQGLLLLPGFGRNKVDMEKMMGLTDPVDFVEDYTLTWSSKLRQLPRLLATAARMLYAFTRLKRDVPEWLDNFEQAYARLDRRRFVSASFSELMQWLQQLDDEVLSNWHTPIINDFAVMMCNGRLHRLVATSGVPNPDIVTQQLLGGEDGIESTEPTRLLMRMAVLIRQQPNLVEVVQHQEPLAVVTELRNYPELHEMFCHYIERYGDRTMGELKLETVSFREDPGFVIEILRNYLGRQDLDPDQLASREKQNRAGAERLLGQHLGVWGSMRADRILRGARASIKHRENMRLTRTRAFGLARDLYRALGLRLVESGQLTDPQDVFYLTVEEIRDYFKGRAVTTNLKGLTALRKADYAQYENQQLPHQFETRGPVYSGNRYAAPQTVTIDGNERTLKGIGCYPGVVEERLKIIHDPRGDLCIDGQVLVAERTDPGWAPLFPTCSGILVERGSTLSHSAVIARELGIPAVVGVANLFAIVKDGESVRLDGGQGTVERLDMEAREETGGNHE